MAKWKLAIAPNVVIWYDKSRDLLMYNMQVF